MSQWKYYGYGGGVELHEIYRCPSNDKPLWMQSPQDVQIALPNSLWGSVQSIKKLQASNITGWFNEDDELDEDAAFALLGKWNKDGWPS